MEARIRSSSSNSGPKEGITRSQPKQHAMMSSADPEGLSRGRRGGCVGEQRRRQHRSREMLPAAAPAPARSRSSRDLCLRSMPQAHSSSARLAPAGAASSVCCPRPGAPLRALAQQAAPPPLCAVGGGHSSPAPAPAARSSPPPDDGPTHHLAAAATCSLALVAVLLAAPYKWVRSALAMLSVAPVLLASTCTSTTACPTRSATPLGGCVRHRQHGYGCSGAGCP